MPHNRSSYVTGSLLILHTGNEMTNFGQAQLKSSNFPHLGSMEERCILRSLDSTLIGELVLVEKEFQKTERNGGEKYRGKEWETALCRVGTRSEVVVVGDRHRWRKSSRTCPPGGERIVRTPPELF